MTDDGNTAAATLAELPLMPRDDDGPVFSEAWQADAFAVVVALLEDQTITANEWAKQLGAALQAAESRGETDTGRRYYDHWLTALENIVVAKRLANRDDLVSAGQAIRERDHHRREDQLHHDH